MVQRIFAHDYNVAAKRKIDLGILFLILTEAPVSKESHSELYKPGLEHRHVAPSIIFSYVYRLI